MNSSKRLNINYLKGSNKKNIILITSFDEFLGTSSNHQHLTMAAVAKHVVRRKRSRGGDYSDVHKGGMYKEQGIHRYDVSDFDLEKVMRGMVIFKDYFQYYLVDIEFHDKCRKYQFQSALTKEFVNFSESELLRSDIIFLPVEQTVPDRDEYSDPRANFIADEFLKIGSGRIVTLDGRVNNVTCMINSGVNPDDIHIVEHNFRVALYEKACGSNVNIHRGDMHKFLRKSEIKKDITAVYYDFCGGATCMAECKEALEQLPNLKLYAITQTKTPRRAKQNDAIPILAGFKMIKFYERKCDYPGERFRKRLTVNCYIFKKVE